MLTNAQRDAGQYFLDHTSTETGLTLDSSRKGSPASIAATGFGLAAVAIGANHGWIPREEAKRLISITLDTLEANTSHRKGFFYHFFDAATGRRAWASEVSSIDTALLIAGALVASTYFEDSNIPMRVLELYERIDWPWMLNGSRRFCHGWNPKTGFLPYYWDMYSEHLILQALAQGSEKYAVDPAVWDAWTREKELYEGREIVYAYSGSLFTYQYSHAFIDFRNLSDHGIDYFINSQNATHANRLFSSEQATDFDTYRVAWGLSASLGPDGYRAYGALPGEAYHDGTVAIHAVIGSLVFTPETAVPLLQKLRHYDGGKLYGRYGFIGSFNEDARWTANEYLGIDQGLVVLMLENFLNEGDIWNRFMRLPSTKRWLARTSITRDKTSF